MELWKMSDSFWINEELDKNQLDFGSYKIVPESDWELLIMNLVDRVVGSIEVEDFTTVPYHTSPYEMDGIEPGDISYISVKEINIDYNDADVKQFLRDYFTEVRERGGTATWYPDRDLEYGEVEYLAYPSRDIEPVDDLDTLENAYQYLGSYSSEDWHEWIQYEAEHEEDETPDEFGLTSYTVYYRYPLPPEIQLDPQTWRELVEEAMSTGRYEYIDWLVEVPIFIMSDDYQKYKDEEGEKKTYSYEQWEKSGGVGYMLSVIDEIISSEGLEDFEIEWVEELRNSIVSKMPPNPDQLNLWEDE